MMVIVWFNDECPVREENLGKLQECLTECKAFPIGSDERDECEFRCYMKYCEVIE